MNMLCRLCVAGLLMIFLVVPSQAQEQTEAVDWPCWMGANMEGVWTETGIIERFEESGPDFAWRYEVGGGYGGPAVANGRVFLMDRMDEEKKGDDVENGIAGKVLEGGERVLCLDAKTGALIWEHKYDCPYSVAYPTGPRCTPAIDGEYVYTLGAMGDLICLKSETGEVVWQNKLTESYETKPPFWGFASHPLVYNDRLLVPVGGEGSGVVAFDKLTGQEIWRSLTTSEVAYAPLVVYEPEGAEAQLIFWHADGVSAMSPEAGDVYWNVKFPEEVNASKTSIATPRIVGDKLFISEFYKGSLLLQMKSDPPGVEELWRSFKTDPRHKVSLNSMMTTPFIKEGHIYGIGHPGRANGELRCLNLGRWCDGLVRGQMDGGRGHYVSRPHSSSKTKVATFMFNDNGELMIANITPDGFEMIDKAKVLEPTSVARGRDVVWSHPAYSGRKMFARNDKEIVCVDLAKPE